ncbi:hypothetical protein Ae201684P_007273 [Aphanomyces euteiches]|uniref:Uncharacterized protein n=1 Tax=Aphanomyces euteiches TaxID=100861 RepID=A0A6G0X890_9STRA|nr:hypothetical protein Ae201684_007283 [Aphanomyces euteiches]KAH9101085.1 hypothetical protein Ae201684P_007273 [Aphanomyces euteiches]
MTGNITKEVLESILSRALSSLQRSTSSMESLSQINSGGLAFDAFNWQGRFHHLPESFVFPSVGVCGAWHLWWCGNASQRWSPICQASFHDFSNRIARNSFYQWKYVMTKMVSYLQEKSLCVPRAGSSNEVVQTAFDQAIKAI